MPHMPGGGKQSPPPTVKKRINLGRADKVAYDGRFGAHNPVGTAIPTTGPTEPPAGSDTKRR